MESVWDVPREAWYVIGLIVLAMILIVATSPILLP